MSTDGQVALWSSHTDTHRTARVTHNVDVQIKDCDDLGYLWCTLVDAAERCQHLNELRLHVCLSSSRGEVWHQVAMHAARKCNLRCFES